jgi:hypothetical protein
MHKQQPFRRPRPQPSVGQGESVVVALEEQVDCYRRLAKLASIQHEYVQQEQVEALLDLLRRREEVLERISRLEQLLGPVKKTWTAFVEGMSGERRARAEALFAETRRLLEAITTSDQDDVLVLQQRKLNLGRQIGQAVAQRSMNQKYAAGAYGQGQSTQVNVQR